MNGFGEYDDLSTDFRLPNLSAFCVGNSATKVTGAKHWNLVDSPYRTIPQIRKLVDSSDNYTRQDGPYTRKLQRSPVVCLAALGNQLAEPVDHFGAGWERGCLFLLTLAESLCTRGVLMVLPSWPAFLLQASWREKWYPPYLSLLDYFYLRGPTAWLHWC